MLHSPEVLKASILIVDDQAANVTLLEEMLRGDGYVTIASTQDPRAVCELHRKNHYDLILLDLQMPGMDGFQVMERLKEVETDGYLPVLVITAQPDQKLRALKAGAKDFVSKPFDLAEILIRISNMLEVRRQHLHETLLNAARLENAQRIARLGDWEYDFASQRLVWSAEIYRILGIARDESPPDSQRFFDLVHPDDLAFVVREKKAATAGLRRADFEHRIIRPDGNVRHLHQIAETTFDGHGRPARQSGTLQDITERKIVEGALRESEQSLKAIFEQAAVGVVQTDVSGRFLRVNQRFCDLVGYTREELEPLTFTRITHEQDVGLDLENLARLRDDSIGESAREKRYVCHNGKVVWVTLAVSSIGAPDKPPTSFIVVAQEITARKQAEAAIRQLNADLEMRVTERTAQLESANQELAAFSYSISHDLRSPLRAMRGYSDALLEDCGAVLPASGRHHVEIIRAETQRLATLIDDLLEFSRLGRQELRRQPVAMADVVQLALQQLEPERQGREIDLKVGELPSCDGDAVLLRQVWINLLSNALKYTQKCARAQIEVGCLLQEGRRVYYVRDNGAGFDMRYADKLFGVFQRLHRADDYEGTGVGLAIVHQIVRRHGGRIWAEAAVGRGATFFFTLEGSL